METLKKMEFKLTSDRGIAKLHFSLFWLDKAKGFIKPVPCPNCEEPLHYNATFQEIFCINCKYARTV